MFFFPSSHRYVLVLLCCFNLIFLIIMLGIFLYVLAICISSSGKETVQIFAHLKLCFLIQFWKSFFIYCGYMFFIDTCFTNIFLSLWLFPCGLTVSFTGQNFWILIIKFPNFRGPILIQSIILKVPSKGFSLWIMFLDSVF